MLNLPLQVEQGGDRCQRGLGNSEAAAGRGDADDDAIASSATSHSKSRAGGGRPAGERHPGGGGHERGHRGEVAGEDTDVSGSEGRCSSEAIESGISSLAMAG